ncbi:hypothetical protein F8S13_22425 [Chloroflexia bacterium SDU3-3]|nr:hypothetical protein F8S13_22425 [Chloroflexia bacterium SDU3-3]
MPIREAKAASAEATLTYEPPPQAYLPRGLVGKPAAAPAPAPAPAPAVEAAPAAAPQATRTAAVLRPPRPAPAPTQIPWGQSGVGWSQQMYVYSVLLLFGYIIWGVDGAFTVIGAVTTILPPTALGVLIAIGGHFFLSWGQHALVFHPQLAIRSIGFGLLGINVLSNIYGLISTAQRLRPEMLGTMPTDPARWTQDIGTWITGLIMQTVRPGTAAPDTPPWIGGVLIVIILALILAWYAEKIRDYFQAQWKSMWALRPTAHGK